MAEPEEMWQCQTLNCGYIYNPERGDRKGKIPKGTRFQDLPDDWKCPICGASKKMFKPLAGPGSVAAEGTWWVRHLSTLKLASLSWPMHACRSKGQGRG